MIFRRSGFRNKANDGRIKFVGWKCSKQSSVNKEI